VRDRARKKEGQKTGEHYSSSCGSEKERKRGRKKSDCKNNPTRPRWCKSIWTKTAEGRQAPTNLPALKEGITHGAGGKTTKKTARERKGGGGF